jgi:hypothetical protein
MKRFVSFFLMIYVGVLPALAQAKPEVIPPGNWAKVEALARGADISVRLLSGDRLRGEFLDLGIDAISIREDAQERLFPRKGVAEIQLFGVARRSHRNLVLGTVTGALGGMLLSVGLYQSRIGMTNLGVEAAAMGAIGAGAGAGIGCLVDRAHQGSEVIYRAPAKR